MENRQSRLPNYYVAWKLEVLNKNCDYIISQLEFK